MRYFFTIIIYLLLSGFRTEPVKPILEIIPKPRNATMTGERTVIAKNKLVFQFREEYRSAIEYFNSMNSRINHFEIPFNHIKDTSECLISFHPLKTEVKEQYEIKVEKNNIQLHLSDNSVIPAFSSLIQLFYQYNFQDEIRIPLMSLIDWPEYQWRGMHLDVCRHFFKIDFIKKYIDLLAFYKMNVFHWHLTEDQGWRIEIKKYPRLTEVGAWRKGSMIGHYNEQRFDTIKYGGYYTQEEIKELVNYAKVRGVTIVPEIELPGHALAALAAYPDLSCTGGPFEVAKSWGVFDDVFCPKESTFEFIENVLAEVCELFPGEYIHIGGDECPKIRWKNCSNCQSLMKKEGLKDEHELQSYFIRRIERFLNSKGKKIIGWDEILEGGLAPNAAVMSWRGTEGGIAAAKMKHQVVMTPGSHCYFDHYQAYPANEPVAIGGYTTLQKVYSYNPRDEKLSEEEKNFVMGAQGNVWTEYMNTPEHVEYMVFPRILALSEVLWSDPTQKDEYAFVNRVIQQLQLLSALKVNYSESMFLVELKTENKNKVLQVSLTGLPGTKIYYQVKSLQSLRQKLNLMDDLYDGPIQINQSCMIRAYLELANGDRKQVLNQKLFVSKCTSAEIKFETAPSEHYKGKGASTLQDGIRANLPRINAEWLAWSGVDMIATIDLGKIDSISMIDIGYLQDQKNWIYAPQGISISISSDGKKFKQIKSLTTLEVGRMPRDIVINFNNAVGRYLKITAKNAGKIPEGKPGAGNPSWLFFDEIIID